MRFTNELKLIDTPVSIPNISTTGSWTKLNNATSGTGFNQRIGDRYRTLSIEFQGQIALNAAASDAVRFVLIQTKGTVTSAPVTTTMLVGNNPAAPYVYNSRELYEVLHDEYHSFAIQGDSAIQTRRFALKPRIPEMKLYTGTNDVYNGQLYAMFLCNTLNNTNVVGYFRVWFEDS